MRFEQPVNVEPWLGCAFLIVCGYNDVLNFYAGIFLCVQISSTTSVKDIWADINRPTKNTSTAARRAVVKNDPALARWLGVKKDASKKPAPSQRASTSQKRTVVDKALAGWLAAPSVRKSESLTATQSRALPTSSDTAAPCGAKNERETSVGVQQKSSSGLESVLQTIKENKAERVIDKTRKNWAEFKDKDSDIAEELEAYKKDKNRYTDRVAFLQRTDVREWEADMARKRTR